MTKILVIKEQRKRQPIVKVTRLQNSYKLVSNVNIFFNDDYQIIYKHFVPFCESEETVVVEEETNIQLSCHKKKANSRFKKAVPIQYVDESYESKSCKSYQDSCFTVTTSCSSNSG